MSKKTLRLLVILIILFGVSYLYKNPVQNWADFKKSSNEIFANINPDDLTKIEIVKDSATTTLEKEGDKLKVSGTKGFYVDEEVSKQILDSMKETKTATLDLVSDSPDRKSEFGTDENGIKVSLYQKSGEAVNFIIGKLASNFVDNYISVPNKNETFSLKDNLFSLFSRDEWRDNKIFKNDQTKISKIRFQVKGSEISLEKKEDVWGAIKPDNYKIDTDKLNKALALMANLDAYKIPTQSFSGTGLEKNSLIVEATGDNFNNILMVGDEFKGTDEETGGYKLFYVKKGDSDNIYLIKEEEVNQLEAIK